MPLQAAGAISLDDIVAQFRPGYSGTSNIEEYYRGGDHVPGSVTGRADVQTIFGSGTRANQPNNAQTLPEVYEFRLGEDFTTTPLEVDQSESFDMLVSQDEIGSTGIFVTGGVTAGTASTFSGGGGTADVNYVRTNGDVQRGTLTVTNRFAGAAAIGFSTVRPDRTEFGTIRITAETSFARVQYVNGNPTTDAARGPAWVMGDSGLGLTADQVAALPMRAVGAAVTGSGMNGSSLSFSGTGRATVGPDVQLYNYAVRNDRTDGVSVVLTSPVSQTLAPGVTSGNYRTNTADTSDSTAITGSLSWPSQAQFGASATATRGVTLTRSDGGTDFGGALSTSTFGDSSGIINVADLSYVTATGTGRGNHTVVHYPLPNGGGHPTQIFSFQQDDNTGITVSYRGAAYQSGDGGIPSGSQQITTGSIALSGFNQSQQIGRRAQRQLYNYSATNTNAFPITLTGGISGGATLPASRTSAFDLLVGTTETSGTIGWSTQAVTSAQNFFAAHNTNNYAVSVNGVNVPANTNFNDRVTFASSLASPSVTARVTATVPVTTLPTFSIDFDASDTVFTAGPITGTFPVNAGGLVAMSAVQQAIEDRVDAGDYSGISSDDISEITQSDGVYRFTVNTNQTVDLTGTFSCVANQGRNVDCSLNAEFQSGNVMVPSTLITVTDPEGTQVTSFSAGSNQALTGSEGVMQAITNAINSFDETPPTNYTAVLSSDGMRIVVTAATDVAVANPWRVTVDHGNGTGDIQFGSSSSNTSGNAARTTPGVTPAATLNASIPEDGEITFEDFYGTRRLTAEEAAAQ